MAGWSAQRRFEGRRVAFVPTMGALHEGHLELVRVAGGQGHAVVVSIFVNPLQFNDPRDLAKYPRQLEKDMELLSRSACEVVFTPQAESLFKGFKATSYDLGALDSVLEGPSRPGHFQGVVNVVERLFHYVRPDLAFFGEKDRQQLAVIRHVATAARWPEAIHGVPIVRSKDGLALSSRNARLSAQEAEAALVLYQSLTLAQRLAFQEPVQRVVERASGLLQEQPGVVLDYFSIADAHTLQPLTEWSGRSEAVALVAAQVGPVRLIDNITLRR